MLEKNLQGMIKGVSVKIDPINYKYKIAVASFANSATSTAFSVIDFNSNKIYQTKFSISEGLSFYPILIANADKLIAIHQVEEREQESGIQNIELDLTDQSGNVLKVLRQFNISGPIGGGDFWYVNKFDDNYISINGQGYVFDSNYNLVTREIPSQY